MTIDVRCLTYAIGLSRTECDCFDFPELASRSDSGLYLDELDPLSSVIIDQRSDCEKGNINELMDKARDNAISDFNTELMTELLKTYKLKRPVFRGEIGRRTWDDNLDITGTWAVLRMPVVDVISGEIEITGIGAMFAQTTSFVLQIWNSLGEKIDEFTIQTTADAYRRTSISLTLPLHRDGIQNLEYFFVYPLAGLTPKNNALNCTECDCPFTFNLKKPFWTMTAHQKGWWNWSMFQGCTQDDLDFMCLDSCSISNFVMLGLNIQAVFRCKIDETICLGDGISTGLDFQGDPDAMLIAKSIQLRAGVNLLRSIMAQPELNRYTLANRDTLIEFMNNFQTKFIEKIEDIAPTIDIHKNNDCLDCRDTVGFEKKTIFS